MKEMKILLTVEVASLAALVAAGAITEGAAVEVGAWTLLIVGGCAFAAVALTAVWVLARTIAAAIRGE